MKIQPLLIYSILPFLALTSLSGCAIVAKQYPPPAAGTEVAFLRVIKQGTDSLPPKTSVFTFAKAATCEGRFWIYNEMDPGKEHVAPNGFAKVEAGHPFSLMTITTISNQYVGNGVNSTFCAPVVTFVPIAGRHYVAEEHHTDGQCFLRIISAKTASMANPQIEIVKKKRFTRGWDESSSWCQPE